ncbi:DUF21 domain-containing protein At4g14240-like isoform X2 [Papaver somniferum]|uniref:DUF21 domain-containing protein At4g14240-like isoform X2 n=1 Tax=Papaver somniferum TaxID=3469 RepID=UPI000E6F6DA8|nr:DUF21 domain-containing protein At4g14240-like isoform X2 [Papaver somniferum]
MMMINALEIARGITREFGLRGNEVEIGSSWWFIYLGISCFLVLFAGIMSGLTLGLMSLGLVELEILHRSGTPTEKQQAAAILPIVQNQHRLLVTLLLCNACAMEALPIFLDKMFNPIIAIVLSVTFVLFFGEVIPQAICTRYGLAVGANLVWLVRILMIICTPIAYPIAKVLDCVLGHNDALFPRAQLKALVSMHGQEAGKGGELTHDETTIIAGALDLTEKTAEEAMTPIDSTFSLDLDSNLDWETIAKILARGHSRVPVYSGNPRNIIGLLLKGSSHMAAVVKKSKGTTKKSVAALKLTTPPLPRQDEESEETAIDIEKISSSSSTQSHVSFQQNDVTTYRQPNSSEDTEDMDVIGIITLEDIFEELLQEEIVDETDEYIDVHKRIRVAAVVAAATSVARIPSIRRMIASKGAAGGGESKPGQSPKKSGEDDSTSAKQGSISEPLLAKKKQERQ